MTDYLRDRYATLFTGPTGCGKGNLVLGLFEKKKTNILTTSLLHAQKFNGTRYIMPRQDRITKDGKV